LTLLVPLGSLVVLTLVEVRTTGHRRDEVLDQTDLARAAIGPSGVITTLQNELNFASVDLTGFGDQVSLPITGYDETRRQTDEAIDAFRDHVDGASSRVQEILDPAIDQLGALAQVRTDIDAYSGPRDVSNVAFSQEVIDRYNALIVPLLDAAQDVGNEVGDEQLRIGLKLSDAVTRQVTTVQQIIGTMVKGVLFSPGGIDRRDEILQLIDLRVDLIEQADTMSSASGVYGDLPGAEESAALTHRIDDQVLFAIGANQVDLNLMVDTLGNPEEQPYYAFQTAVQEIVSDRADDLEGAAERRQRLMLVLAGVTLAAAIVVVTAISRSISGPLLSLADQARKLATERLPGAVHQLLAAPAGMDLDEPSLAPVEVRSTDEVAEVADALNTLQSSAIDLAAGQAVLRRNIADSLVSLGRRNQNLLARQLDFITQLEANETDPRILESLFRLDHLATRMRRNAEGLTVLAELDSPRHWPVPVPLLDVIRSALGEVEDFPRVVVHGVGPLAVMGSAAADLAHLLAELLENALVYSPPDSRVEVGGQYGSGREGYTLAVIDKGVGMPPDELATANRRLGGHESFTVAPSSYLGHYVAGKLARRHGVTIELHPTRGGGITALVHLPPSLITDTAAAPAGVSAPPFGPPPSSAAVPPASPSTMPPAGVSPSPSPAIDLASPSASPSLPPAAQAEPGRGPGFGPQPSPSPSTTNPYGSGTPY
jgi:signal transduction histidine kinase